MAINKLSIYHIIVEDIKTKILNGELKSGDMVPSENQLSREYDTSRVTVRKALSVLINEGYIFTVQGKGNYVSDPNLYEYEFQFKNEESSIETKLISVQIVKPSTDIRIHMQHHSNDKIVEIKSYLTCDGDIIGYALKYMPYKPKEPILEKEFHYINLEEKTDFADKTVKISAESADEEISEILNIILGYPILSLETKIENDSDEVIGYEKMYLIGDRYQVNGE